MGEIIDEGSWLFGAVLVVGLSAVMEYSPAAASAAGRAAHSPNTAALTVLAPIAAYGVLKSLAGLAVCIVPAGISLVVAFEPVGSFGVVFRKDYGSLLACATMAWTAAHLPMVPLSLAQIAPLPVLWTAGEILFVGLLACAFRTLYGAGWVNSAGMAVLSLASLPVGFFLYRTFGGVLSFLASPFILYFLYIALRGEIGDIAHGFRVRQNFKRMMEAAALNPHDADAQVQLGLIYQQRRQYGEAIARFQKALEIDKMEPDAHYQLGRIAREQSRLDDAMRYLEIAAKLDDKLSFSEVWREIGATHLAAGRVEAAEAALQKFVARREYDAEGLYWLGDALSKLKRKAEAEDCFRRCVEAVKTLPSYRRGLMRKWGKLAEGRL
jgi:hypothetical protein